jgi:hypothetical protein
MPRNDREFRNALAHVVIGVAGAQRARAGLREREFVVSLFPDLLSILSAARGASRGFGLFECAARIGENVLRIIGISPAALHRPVQAGV